VISLNRALMEPPISFDDDVSTPPPHCSSSFSDNELLGVFPSEALATEVTVGRRFLVDGVLEAELLDDLAWPEVEVVLDNLEQFHFGFGRGAVAEDGDGEGFGDTDGIRDLDEDAFAKTGLDEGLGDPSGGISGGSVDLGEVLSGEGAATVGSPTTVGVDDDLTAGQTGITHGATDDELAGWLEMVDGVIIQILGGDDFLDDRGHEDLPHVAELDVLVMLDGDDDGVDSLGDAGTVLERVLAGDLGLGVRSEPLAGSVPSELGHFLVKLVGQNDGEGHGLFGLVGSVTEHKSLIAGTSVIFLAVLVDTLGNVG